MKKTIYMGLLIGVIASAMIASTVVISVEKVSATSDPNQRSARDFAPGNGGDPDTPGTPARDFAPGTLKKTCCTDD